MNCPTCKADNPVNSKFCLDCGASFASPCPKCGIELPPLAKFCNGCGHALRPASPQPPASSLGTPSPISYTPKHLADKILQSKSALEGERQQVTVLFADVKGSMELAEQVDPEEWHRILDRFFQILTDGVHRFEGTVNQYTGDGIMALFGAPIVHEDHAQRACYAALRLGEELQRYGQDLKRQRGLNFSVRIGLNSGEVVVGKIDDALATVEQVLQANPDELVDRPENLRRRGALRLTQGQTELAEADSREAIALARRLGAKAYELRATMSLARLLDQQGHRDEARTMLADIYSWFTEGFDTVDVKEAKALLEEL